MGRGCLNVIKMSKQKRSKHFFYVKIGPGHIFDICFNLFQVQAQALYDFQGNAPGELTMKSGDAIYLRWKLDDNWYYGEASESCGLVPVNVVQVTGDRPQPLALCRALCDFNANHLHPEDSKECLTFFKVNLSILFI